MAPMLLFAEDKPLVAYGSPGGATIINSVLNVTLNLVDHGMSVQQAIDAPRLSVTHPGGQITCESGTTPGNFAVAVQDALRALGHVGLGDPGTDGCTATIGSVQAVTIDWAADAHRGAADPRREGTVIQVPPPDSRPGGAAAPTAAGSARRGGS
jgi:gamma-glutamyltranspeptidase/glutathione hydrolase